MAEAARFEPLVRLAKGESLLPMDATRTISAPASSLNRRVPEVAPRVPRPASAR